MLASVEVILSHLLNDILRSGLSIVFCGTAAGKASVDAGAYYAHSNNKFWSILHETGITPSRLEPRQFEQLLDYNVGLTDILKDVAGNDDEVRRATPADLASLRAKIEEAAPAFLAFTSKRAGQLYCGRRASLGEQPTAIGATRVFILPSTSLAARWQWSETVKHWHDFAGKVKGA